MYTDSHSHLSFLNLEQALQVMEQGSQKKLRRWVLGGYNPEDWEKQSRLKARLPEAILTAFGIHPWVVIDADEEEVSSMMTALEKKRSLGDVMGEMGLDFFHPLGRERRSQQELFFRKQLEGAGDKPCVLHIVQAHGRALEILEDSPNRRGWVHGFTGSWDVAQKYIERGFLISVGRHAQKDHFRNLQEVISKIPLENLLIESDAPRNPTAQEDPVEAFFKVARTVADRKQVTVSTLLEHSHNNLSRILNG